MSSRPSRKDKGGKSGHTNDAAAADGGEDVFPDLHHKMSKKIAQLTKVIYHLNTKNEDHASIMEALGVQHELEMELLAKDAHARLASQKEMAEMKQKLALQATQMTKLAAKHTAEKQKTLAEFEKFKAASIAREEQLASEWQFKCDQLHDDVDKMNKRFAERVSSFEEARKSLAAGVEAARASGGDAATALARKHEKEVEELVRVSNQKYQDMLIQNLASTEALKKDYESKIAALQKEMESYGQARMDKELGQLRAKMSAEMQEALMKAKRESDVAMQAQRDDLMGKLEKALADIKTKATKCSQLEEENQLLRQQMHGEVGALLEKHKGEMGAADQKLQNSAIEVAQLRQQIKNLQQDIADAQDSIMQHTKDLSQKDSILVQNEGKIAELQRQVQQLQLEALESARTGAAGQDQLLAQLQETRGVLNASQKECSALEKARAALETSLADSRSELANLHLKLKELQASFEQSLHTEKAEKATLLARLNELNKQSLSDSEALMRDMAALRQKIQLAERELVAAAEKHALELSIAVGAVEERSRKELESMKKMNDALFDKNGELGRDIDALKQVHTQTLDDLRRDHEVVLSKVRAEAKEAEGALKLIVAQLENQLENLTTNADNEKAALQKDFVKAQERAKTLKAELDAKKKEGEGAQGVIAGLKSQIESLREELKASQKAFRDKMDMGLLKLEEDWQRKMDGVIAKHGQALLDAQVAAEEAVAAERKTLLATHEEVQANLRAQAEEEAAKAAATLEASEKERVRALFLLKQEKEDRSTERSDTALKHASELERQTAEATATLLALRAQLSGDAESATRALIDKHAKDVEAQRTQAAKSLQEQSEAHTKVLNQAAKDAQHAQEAALDAQRAKLSSQFELATKELTGKHSKELVDMIAQHKDANLAIQNELLQLKTVHSQLCDAHGSLESELNDEKARAAKQAQHDKLQIQNLIRDNDMNVRNEKESGQRALLEQQKRFDADTKILKLEFSEDRARFERALEVARREYSALEEKYQNRESRPDDLARIQQLEYEMVEKDELVKNTRDEMMYLKRELINREESYNSKFNATPNVGVMQVIKDPAAKAAAAKVPPGIKSNKPTRVVGAAQSMGMGLGVGMGVLPAPPGNGGIAPLPTGSRDGKR